MPIESFYEDVANLEALFEEDPAMITDDRSVLCMPTGRQSTDTSAKMARMWEFSHKYDKVLTMQIHKLQSLTFFKQMLQNRTSHKRYKENPS